MKHFVLKNVDGSVQVMQLIEQTDGTYSTPEVEIAKWAPQKRAEVESWREISVDELPADRAFRDAWCDVAKKVDVDMPKAREIHRGRLRKLRADKLAALDIDMTRAFGDYPKQTAIDAKRQELRDVTKHPSIDEAKTPEELMKAGLDVIEGISS